jgi:hypothetical protein
MLILSLSVRVFSTGSSETQWGSLAHVAGTDVYHEPGDQDLGDNG